MRVIAVDAARVTILFPIEEVVPLDGITSADIIDDVVSRYAFAKRPDLTLPKDELQKVGLKFENGRCQFGNRTVSILSCTVFTDGVVIDASNTDDAEEFWEDVSKWMIAEKRFRDFTIKPARRFISQVVVEFDKPLSKLFKSFEVITELVSNKINEVYETNRRLDLGRLDLEFGRISEFTTQTLPKFIIERRANIQFSRERYYCSAPIRTKDHLRVLEEIEEVIA
jgi:hypothetical protein